MRPLKGTYPQYYENYISLVKENSILDALQQNEKEVTFFFTSIPPSKENYAYELGKWNVKQVFNHIIDTERVFCYRALRYARKDETLLSSFDQDQFVKNADLDDRNLPDVVNEFSTVRKCTLSLYQSFGDEALLRCGSTPAGKASVLSIGFTVCGHALHHLKVLRELYLKN